MSKPGYVIIGNSAAAVGAITAIRQADGKRPITILSKETEHVYSRPLITYLLGGKIDESQMDYRPRDFYERYQVEPRLGVEAVGLDADKHVVRTADGEELAYGKLLIATGGKPIVPPELEGADSPGVFTFTNWQNARDIAAYIKDNQVISALVVGGGLIGLKSVEALSALGLKITVVELADRVLSITLDETGSDMAAKALAKAGVDLLCSTTVSSIQNKWGRVTGAVLSDGKEVDCGLVVLAIGVRPDADLAKEAGIEVDRGIVADDHMRTSAEDVYVAGDVAQATELLSGQKMPIPIWPNAFRQGFVAGTNMAGGDLLYEGGLAMNAVEICGLPTISVGLTSPKGKGYEILSDEDEEAGTYRKLVLKKDRVVGSVLVGEIERAGIITGLIKGGMNVAAFKHMLLGEEFGLITLPSNYRTQVSAGKGVVT